MQHHQTDSSCAKHDVLRACCGHRQTCFACRPAPFLCLLQVPDEDIVLYTVNRYFQRQRTAEIKQAARRHLAPLIRVPELSNRWLMELLAAEHPNQLVLYPVLDAVRCLVALQQVLNLSGHVRPSTAPTNWSPRPRQWTSYLGSVQCAWYIEVSQLKQLGVAACESRTIKYWLSPDSSPPLQGASFGLLLVFQGSEAGSCLGAACRQVPSSPSAAAQVFINIGYTTALAHTPSQVLASLVRCYQLMICWTE